MTTNDSALGTKPASDDGAATAEGGMEPLSVLPRRLLGIGGSVLVLAGAVGVFVPGANVVGVLLLLLLGGSFCYVSASGQPLLQLNKDGFKLAALKQRRVEALEDVISKTVLDASVPEEAVDRIVHAVDDLTPPQSYENERDFQFRVELQLKQLSRRHGFSVTAEPVLRTPQGAPVRPDFMLASRGGDIKVPLELKAPRQANSSTLHKAIGQVVGYRDASASETAILMVNCPVSLEMREQATASGIILLSSTSVEDFIPAVAGTLASLGLVR